MANSPRSELFTTLKGYFTQLTEGERTPTEVASAFNEWAREGAESIKAKISEEVEITVSKMGFIKRDEFNALEARLAKLERAKSASPAPAKKALKKNPPIKEAAKARVKKSVKKVSK